MKTNILFIYFLFNITNFMKLEFVVLHILRKNYSLLVVDARCLGDSIKDENKHQNKTVLKLWNYCVITLINFWNLTVRNPLVKKPNRKISLETFFWYCCYNSTFQASIILISNRFSTQFQLRSVYEHSIILLMNRLKVSLVALNASNHIMLMLYFKMYDHFQVIISFF